MKKLSFLFTLSLLLTACGQAVAPTVDEVTSEESSAKVMAPQPFYITDVSLENGELFISADPVVWLLSPDGCTDTASTGRQDLPQCNPNGFLIVNETSEDILSYVLPKETPVYAQNLLPLLGMENTEITEEGTLIGFEDLLLAFEENTEFFTVTPFEIEYGTRTVEGVEMSDQITSLKEIYIP